MELCLEIEPPERRVRAWLECVTQQEPVESDSDDQKKTRSTCSDDFIIQSTKCITNRQSKKITRYINKKTTSSVSDSNCDSSTSYRRLYTFEECNAIIRYIINNDVFPFLKGNLLWKKMEMDVVCHRSWQSMKAQFIKKIIPHLGTYSLNETDREKFVEYTKPSIPKKSVALKPGERGWRRNGNYYRISEDKIIINYVLQKKRYLCVRGNSIWQTMEDVKILPDRSWQSMRSRYLNFIVRDLEQYKLKESDVRKLTRGRRNDPDSKKMQEKQSSQYSETFHKRNDSFETVNKQKKQDIRRHALTASVYLAANLGVSKKTRGQMSEKENVTNHKLLTEGSVCTGTQPYVKGDNKITKNCAITKAEHVILNSPVSSSKKDGITVLSECEDKVCDHTEFLNLCNKCHTIKMNERVANIQTSKTITKLTCIIDNSRSTAKSEEIIEDDDLRENEQICVSKNVKDRPEMPEHKSEHSLIDLEHENTHASDSDIEVNGTKDSLQDSSPPGQRDEDIHNQPNPEKIVDDSLKTETCAAAVEETTTNPVICQNSVESEKVYMTYSEDQDNAANCDDYSICSNSTIICKYNSNIQSESASAVLPMRPYYQDDMINRTACSYSHVTIRNCEKCSAPHKLSPSSN